MNKYYSPMLNKFKSFLDRVSDLLETEYSNLSLVLNKYGVFFTITLFAILAFISPFLFTRHVDGFLDFSDTGEIGDTIGGLTAPFIGLLNAVLLWWTLRKQRDSFRQERMNDENDRYQERLNDEIDRYSERLNSLINNLKIETTLRFPMGDDEFSKELVGVHHGLRAFYKLEGLFYMSVDFDRLFEINGFDFSLFVTASTDSFLSALHIVRKYPGLNIQDTEREILYDETMSTLDPVIRVFDKITEYVKTHTESPAISIYNLERLSEFGKSKIDLLNEYKPS
jgi:hypothetical protein